MTKRRKPSFGISSVERDVGLSKDVLRVWERRYGFPTPLRDAAGQRHYAADEVERLRLIKRLIDQGHRPGSLLRATPQQLAAWSAAASSAAGTDVASDPARDTSAGDPPPTQATGARGAQDIAEMVASLDDALVSTAVRHRLAQQGLLRFVMDTVAPLVDHVGAEWARGRMPVHREHLWCESTRRVLQQAIAGVPAGAAPRVLLTTLPGEPHTMGLLMVEAMLVLDNATCIALGPELPLPDIVAAATAQRADIVTLSFSQAFPRRLAAEGIGQLRSALPTDVALWVGGEGTRRVAVAGVEVLHTLPAVAGVLAAWRRQREDTGDAAPRRPKAAARGGDRPR